MEISNPHDKLFKEIESIKENAEDLIRGTFPANLLERIDLGSLKLDNNSYIDENLQEYFSDLVYECKYTGKVTIKISLLFEHKSYVPDFINLQLLKYILGIWEAQIKQKKKPQIIIPMVFYHGKIGRASCRERVCHRV